MRDRELLLNSCAPNWCWTWKAVSTCRGIRIGGHRMVSALYRQTRRAERFEHALRAFAPTAVYLPTERSTGSARTSGVAQRITGHLVWRIRIRSIRWAKPCIAWGGEDAN